MKKFKGIRHEKEFDTMTLVTDISNTNEIIEGEPTKEYEPRPLTPEDDIYEDIIEQFATAPTKPKYWFEEFGDYWSCSCGHINRGDNCKSCGLDRELLRSLFILHKPAGEIGKLDKKLKNNKEQADKEAEQYADREVRRKEREASGKDLTEVVPIYTDVEVPPSEPSSETALAVSEQKLPAKKVDKHFSKRAVLAIFACIILIAVGGLLIYKHMAAPAMQYDEAQQLMDSGKYEAAIEKYASLGDYKDSADLIFQCRVLMGDEYYESGEFPKAINEYETALDLNEDKSLYEKIRLCYIGIGDKYFNENDYEKALGAYAVAAEIAAGEDVQQKIDDAKFGYVKAFMGDRTEQVEEYMTDLMDSNYPGIQQIYDEYYAWHTSIIANTSETDYESDLSTVSRKDTVYFHASLSGGEPSETVHLYYEVKWPDGRSEIYDLGADWKAGDKIAARFQYPIPLFGKEGKMTFSLYDMNTRELLGSDAITFKN